MPNKSSRVSSKRKLLIQFKIDQQECGVYNVRAANELKKLRNEYNSLVFQIKHYFPMLIHNQQLFNSTQLEQNKWFQRIIYIENHSNPVPAYILRLSRA